jgi:hypothetical protein
MITKIRVKSKHIEFQLDGGGYGTMSDETSTSVSVASAPKSRRERNLEAELERQKDPVKRRELKEELDDLQNDREWEDARNRAEVADAASEGHDSRRSRSATRRPRPELPVFGHLELKPESPGRAADSRIPNGHRDRDRAEPNAGPVGVA